jgi:hypothetical protein
VKQILTTNGTKFRPRNKSGLQNEYKFRPQNKSRLQNMNKNLIYVKQITTTGGKKKLGHETNQDNMRNQNLVLLINHDYKERTM